MSTELIIVFAVMTLTSMTVALTMSRLTSTRRRDERLEARSRRRTAARRRIFR